MVVQAIAKVPETRKHTSFDAAAFLLETERLGAHWHVRVHGEKKALFVNVPLDGEARPRFEDRLITFQETPGARVQLITYLEDIGRACHNSRGRAANAEDQAVSIKEVGLALVKSDDSPSTDLVEVVAGQVMTNSLKVAEGFGKKHKDVLKAVQAIECSEEFNQRNFAPVDYTDAKGEKRPMYNMSRDGFTFLAMGFTGKRAAEFKERYISAFNTMEAEIARSRAVTIPETLPDALRLAADEAERRMIAERRLDEVQPKLVRLGRIESAEGSLCVTDAALWQPADG